jgi:transcriptional accessory protein Tex/SPT6
VSSLNKEANRFLLSDTQAFLHNLMDGSDSPFIFEKLGTQLEHIMIDEFQDTSTVQWENFRVLLNETMSRGTNLIVSRRAVQERELEVAKDYLRDTLSEGQTLNGTVVKVLDFGAFVDLGGVEGLVPVREISWDKVVKPSDFVKEGDLVTVKILSLDWERERISLSIRQCQAKPLKPRTPEELAAEAEAKDVQDWMDAHKDDNSGFSSLGSAFDGLKL